MRLGIVADIHEDAEKLALALRRFRGEGVDRVVCLGDVAFALGSGLHETVALLADAGAVGVWGNHDLGLCHEPDEHFKLLLRRPGGRFHGDAAAPPGTRGLPVHARPAVPGPDGPRRLLPRRAAGNGRGAGPKLRGVRPPGPVRRPLPPLADRLAAGAARLGRDRADPAAAGPALSGGGRRRVRRLVRRLRRRQPGADAVPAGRGGGRAGSGPGGSDRRR